MNPDAYDPHYHYDLAIEAGLNAYAAPLGMIEAGADTFAGQIPTILKINSSNSLHNGGTAPHQATTASVKDALRLGCSAIGFTIYPGSDAAFDMFEEITNIAEEAKANGLAVVIWSYPRGGDLSKIGETAMDICAYATHIAAMLGAHIIKVKPPTQALENLETIKVYEKLKIPMNTLEERVRHIIKTAFDGRRIVVFSGGNAKGEDDIYNEIRQIYKGGANGSIIGRNTFQRPREEALKMLDNIIKIYQGK
jgi:class I fructose-bisphosphate aldolase